MKNLKLKVNSRSFPLPLKTKCFKCTKSFLIKYVVPHKAYSKKTTENTELTRNLKISQP
jgi:hypothetical protein